ncbi:MAG: class I SAM-dependent methyltransferase [Pseudomonadota bacterium]
MKLTDILASVWKRVMLRGTAFGGAYGKIRMLYSLEDPWEMSSEREQYRFEQTMEHLREIAPGAGTVLEFGCGEGHQSVHLRQHCGAVFGVDISETAIERARKRCPDATFAVAGLEQAGEVFDGQEFDLITACEVLYYAVDIETILKKIQSSADRVYVSNYLPRSEMMRDHFAGEGWRQLGNIQFADTVWECFLWEAPSVRQPDIAKSGGSDPSRGLPS